MKKEETRSQAEIDELLRQVEQVNNREDKRFGDRRGDELPEELAIREKRIAKIRKQNRPWKLKRKLVLKLKLKQNLRRTQMILTTILIRLLVRHLLSMTTPNVIFQIRIPTYKKTEKHSSRA